ncbi:MAG: extracellular solute-binding protein [Bacillota bacterium]
MTKRKIAAVVVAAAMLLTVLTGCGSKDVLQSTETQPNTVEDTGNGLPIAAEPLELTFHMHFRDSWAYREDWPVYQKAAELTNIKLKATAPPTATKSKEVFNLMIVSGKISDIVAGDQLRDEFIRYGMEGAFMPLNDLIDQHAPNIKAFLEKRPDVKEYASGPDGNIYFIPYIPDGVVSTGYMIRQDWLDKLQLDAPKTVDAFYEVMKAFREKDPNGNGLKDEIPIFNRNNWEVYRLVNLWGAKSGGRDKEFYVDENGKVKHPFIDPTFKVGMANVAKWYKEGLIDPEIFTRGKNSRDVLFGDNLGGFTHDWFGSTADYNEKLKDKVTGFNIQPIAPPADINGKQWEEDTRDPIKPDGWAIGNSNQHPVETIKFFDFWFTEQGRILANFGVEGMHYDMVDGKPVFKDEILHGDKPVTTLLWEAGAQIPIGFHQDFAYEKQWLNDVAVQGMEMYEKNNYCIERMPKVNFTPEEQKIYDDKWPAIKAYLDEATQNWILGGETVEAGWDKYIQTLDGMGMQDILDIYQSAYDRYKSKK